MLKEEKAQNYPILSVILLMFPGQMRLLSVGVENKVSS